MPIHVDAWVSSYSVPTTSQFLWFRYSTGSLFKFLRYLADFILIVELKHFSSSRRYRLTILRELQCWCQIEVNSTNIMIIIVNEVKDLYTTFFWHPSTSFFRLILFPEPPIYPVSPALLSVLQNMGNSPSLLQYQHHNFHSKLSTSLFQLHLTLH